MASVPCRSSKTRPARTRLDRRHLRPLAATEALRACNRSTSLEAIEKLRRTRLSGFAEDFAFAGTFAGRSAGAMALLRDFGGTAGVATLRRVVGAARFATDSRAVAGVAAFLPRPAVAVVAALAFDPPFGVPAFATAGRRRDNAASSFSRLARSADCILRFVVISFSPSS